MDFQSPTVHNNDVFCSSISTQICISSECLNEAQQQWGNTTGGIRSLTNKVLPLQI